MIRYGCGAAAAAAVGQRWLDGSVSDDVSGSDEPVDFKLEAVGKLKTLRASEIDASPFSVGFEVLDRKRFDPTKTYDHLADLGAKWARCQTGWNRCEPAKGEFTFAWLDELPREAWVRFVVKLAEHFADRVTHWEIWNEPNITAFWKPNKPNAADYVEMVKITAPVIRRHVADAVIVGGAFAGVPKDYVQTCLEAGLADHVDRISYHPYRPVPEANYERDLGTFAAGRAAGLRAAERGQIGFRVERILLELETLERLDRRQ
jgi:hypothetical protein